MGRAVPRFIGQPSLKARRRRVLSTRLVPTMMKIVEVAALADVATRQLRVGFASAPERPPDADVSRRLQDNRDL
jgi:hypothetical protein